MNLWTNCSAATLRPQAAQPYGLIDDAALVVDGAVLRWVGPRRDLPLDIAQQCDETHDCAGALITPGLID